MSEEEKNEIAKNNIGLIYHAINRMNLSYMESELFDIGMIGIVRGINTYDKNKGYAISTYLYTCITNEIIKYLRCENALKKQAEIISLDKFLNEDGTTLSDLIGDDPDYDNLIINKEIIERIINRINELPDKWQKIFYSFYGLNGYEKLNQREIAKKYNTSFSYVSQLITRMIRILKYELKEYRRII